MKINKKTIIIILAVALMLTVILFAVSCEENATPPTAPKYTISFVCDGATPIEPITATAGSTFSVVGLKPLIIRVMRLNFQSSCQKKTKLTTHTL